MARKGTEGSPQQKYYCDCPRYCKALREVLRSTFYAHARVRRGDAQGSGRRLSQAHGSSNHLSTNPRLTPDLANNHPAPGEDQIDQDKAFGENSAPVSFANLYMYLS